MNDNDLWSIATPSGVFAAPSRIAAEAKAAELNAFTRLIPNFPLVEVLPWSGTAAEHRLGVKEWAAAERADG